MEKQVNISLEKAKPVNIKSTFPIRETVEVQNHLANTEIHVTSSEKATWNSKQDTININLVEIFEGELE